MQQKKSDSEEFLRSCTVGNIKKVREMLIAGFDPNVTDTLGNTALIKAAQYERLEIVKLLVSYNANVSAKNNAGWTPLKYAVYTNRKDIEALLRKAGAIE